MSDSPTHYQVSFTARQGLSFFVGLLAVLGLSYFFGLMTGLSGREATNEPGAVGTVSENAQLPAPTPAAAGGADENLSFPIPVTAVRGAGGPASAGPARGRVPTPPTGTIHAFEDGEGGVPKPAPRRAVTPSAPAKAATGGFRVQVLSVSTRADADAEAARLTRSGLAARVEPGSGPRGTVYRVRVGPFATREEAEQATRRLSSQGRRDTWIVPPGQ